MPSHRRGDLKDSCEHTVKSPMLRVPGWNTVTSKLMDSVEKRLKDDPITALVMKEFPSAYLVGGYIRDLFLCNPSRDRDYVVTGQMDVNRVKRLAEALEGSYFTVRNLARIVLKDKTEIDISFVLEPIDIDLRKRDFTINSLAWSEKRGLLDPHRGLEDIKKRVVRIVSEENIQEDPVRIIRAYRIAGEINGSIHKGTRDVLVKYRKRLKDSPPERITGEFIKILNLSEPKRYLLLAIKDKVLPLILGISPKILNQNIKLYSKLTNFYKKNSSFLTETPSSQGLSAIGLLRLAVLTYKWKREKGLLRLSRKNLHMIELLHSVIKRLNGKGLRRLKRERIFESLYNIKQWPEAAGFLLSSKRLIREAQRFKEVIKSPFITGHDLRRLNIRPQEIGRLLREGLKYQYLGIVNSKQEAIEKIKTMGRGLYDKAIP